jgi:hypothetical protein
MCFAPSVPKADDYESVKKKQDAAAALAAQQDRARRAFSGGTRSLLNQTTGFLGVGSDLSSGSGGIAGGSGSNG